MVITFLGSGKLKDNDAVKMESECVKRVGELQKK